MITDRDMGWSDLVKGIASLQDAAVYVGIRQENGDKGHTPGEPATIATIATVHEFGSEHVPERSFLRSTVDENEKRYSEALSVGILAVASGETSAKKALEVVGAMAARDVKMGIRRGTHSEWRPLSEKYLKRKTTSKYTGRTKGKGTKSTILIDTGRMVNSIDYQVSIGGKDSAPGETE